MAGQAEERKPGLPAEERLSGAEKVLRAAEGEMGYTEAPPGSNRTKFGEWYGQGMNGQPWCVIFLAWCFDRAGEGAAFMGGGRTASCGALLRWYRERGQTVPVREIRAGDILLMNFRGGKDPEHCALAAEAAEGEAPLSLRTIEGNTTPGEEGSQDNGGCVALKTRYPTQIVAVCRPQYEAETEGPSSGPSDHLPPGEGRDDIAGHWAEESIRWCIGHGLLQGYPDGSFRPNEPVSRAELATVLRRLAER